MKNLYIDLKLKNNEDNFFIKTINNCNNCNLCLNQYPLLDKKKFSDVMWVGLSAKKVKNLFIEIPLDKNTNTGKIIENIENLFENINFYKTNLVKCLPLDKNNKLRYPNISEMLSCYENLLLEIDFFRPKIIFLLGKTVSNFVLKQQNNNDDNFKKISDNSWIYMNTTYVEIYHPSYINVYKKKDIEIYITNIQNIIQNLIFNY